MAEVGLIITVVAVAFVALVLSHHTAQEGEHVSSTHGLVAGSTSLDVCSQGGVVEVALATDERTVDVVGPLIQSAQASSAQPQCLRFHILVPRSAAADISNALMRTLAFHNLAEFSMVTITDAHGTLPKALSLQLKRGSIVRVVPFNTVALDKNIKVVGAASSDAAICEGLEGCAPSRALRLSKATNFARFFLADLLPDLDKVVWVDCDVLVLKDLQVIWRLAFLPHASAPGAFLAAFAEDVPLKRFYFSKETVASLWKQRHGQELDFSAASFNDGVIIMDLRKWRILRVTEEVEWWMQLHKAADPALWKFGTQPIMLLVGSGRWQQLPKEWYVGDLGFRRAQDMDKRLMEKAVVLHFDGEHKPWLPVDVSDVNTRHHGVLASWNSHLLRPHVPNAAPTAWLAAPGARCLHSFAPAATCIVGPLVPGISVPGLLWHPTDLHSMTVGGNSTPSSPLELFTQEVANKLPMAEPFIEGFFSATTLKTLALSVLTPCQFGAQHANPVVEIFFLRPQRLFGAYLQAAGSGNPLHGIRLQARAAGGHEEWHETCTSSRVIACDPHRGPSLSIGTSQVCWQLSDCRQVAAMRWRFLGWAEDQLLGGIWLDVVSDGTKVA